VRRLITLLLLATFTTACAASVAPIEPKAAAPASRRVAERPLPPGCLWRHELQATVKAGLGSFLQRVDVEPYLVDGKFSGFSIVTLRPPAYWRDVDLKPGDIVTSVNGMPIERPTEAFAAFTALSSASELRVSVVRDGSARQLVYRIIERSPAPPEANQTAARGRGEAASGRAGVRLRLGSPTDAR
jgi:hypothetical protein